MCPFAHCAKKSGTIFLKRKRILLKASVKLAGRAASVSVITLTQQPFLFNLNSTRQNLIAFLTQMTHKTNHLHRVFHENLIRVNHKTTVFPIDFIGLTPLITCLILIGIAPGREAKNIRISRKRQTKTTLNNSMLRQTANTITACKMTRKP